MTHDSRSMSIRDWWPNQLNLKVLHQHSPLSNPMGKEFNYAREFQKLDLAAVKKDLRPLRAFVHPHGMAQRRHVPHR
jgi:catalase-peroxidase